MSLIIFDGSANGAPKQPERVVERVVEDALPYVDPYDEAAQSEVLALLEQEMRSFRPPNYLKDRPAVGVNFGSELLAKEWASLEEQEGQYSTVGAVDAIRAQVPPPANPSDLRQWRESLDNAKAQLQYQEVGLENLELSQEFGANAWIQHNAYLEGLKKTYEKILADYRGKVESVNAERKEAQEGAAGKLAGLEGRWADLLRHNLHTEHACIALEAELHTMDVHYNPVN